MRAAAHVRATAPAASRGTDGDASTQGRFPAAQGEGVEMGAVKGTRDNVTAGGDSGFAMTANEPKNAIMISTVTGVWVCRASCSVDDMAATAANIAEYKKKPPRKKATKTSPVAADTCGTWNGWASSSPVPPSRPSSAVRCPSSRRPARPQIRNCNSDTAPTPTTLPASSWNGVTELSSTSTMRDVFSSLTEPITCRPYNSSAI